MADLRLEGGVEIGSGNAGRFMGLFRRMRVITWKSSMEDRPKWDGARSYAVDEPESAAVVWAIA